jgi:hypothetical protein
LLDHGGVRVLVALAAFAILPACRTSGLATTDEHADGGTVDLARPPAYDLATASCDGLDDVVRSLLGAAQTCSAPSDCTSTQTRCGLPGGCDVVMSTSTKSALQPVLSTWDRLGCGNDILCAPCPPPPAQPPGCFGGRCRAAPTTCEEIRTLFDALKASSANSCTTADDCVVTTGPCGLDDCRLVYSKAIRDDINQLTGWWGSLSCPWNGGACAKCAQPDPAVCRAGRCE